MKKAVVVGGSNGMGLAISAELIKKGYYVEITDLAAPNEEELGSGRETYHYTYTNLLYFDEDLFCRLAEDEDVEALVITAGIGRIADFEFHHIAEIEKTFTIDHGQYIDLGVLPIAAITKAGDVLPGSGDFAEGWTVVE